MTVVDLAPYLPSTVGNDCVPAVRAALAAAAGFESVHLRFPQGEWHFFPTIATERYLSVSNNEPGLKRVAFPLFDLRSVTVDGGGSAFVMHGRTIPFAVIDSQEITLRNFSIDWSAPFYGQGRITASHVDHFDLEVDPESFRGAAADGRLIFRDLEWENETNNGVFFIEFDSQRDEPAWDTGTPYAVFEGRSKEPYFSDPVPHIRAEPIRSGIRIHGELGHRMAVGNDLYLGVEARHCPAILVSDSRDVTIEDVRIYHSPTMAVIAQLSRDITLRRTTVTVPPGSSRLISAVADATHFVNCEGQVLLEDCIFENMGDDALNAHGIYTTVAAVDSRRLTVKFHHPQQRGVRLYRVGDLIEVAAPSDLRPKATARIREVTSINDEYTCLLLDEELASVQVGDVVDVPEKHPDLTVRRVQTGRNRGRGLLIGTRGRVVIEDCVFATSGHAIHIAGDASFWYESGPVRDVSVTGSRFNSAGYGYRVAAIAIQPELSNPTGAPYHSNVRITDNIFVCANSQLLKAISCSELVFTNNSWRPTETYPYVEIEDVAQLDIINCPGAMIAAPRECALGG